MTLRQRQAAETKAMIVRSARRLFVRHGYAATTIEAIAAEAGVATPTVYKAFGNKRSIALGINELIDSESGVGPIAARASASSDPREIVVLSVQIGRSLHEHSGDIIALVGAAADGEAELAAVVAEGRRRSVAGSRRAVTRLSELGALRPEFGIEHAAGLFGQLSSAEAFATLVNAHGWTIDACERRLIAAASRLLLNDELNDALNDELNDESHGQPANNLSDEQPLIAANSAHSSARSRRSVRE